MSVMQAGTPLFFSMSAPSYAMSAPATAQLDVSHDEEVARRLQDDYSESEKEDSQAEVSDFEPEESTSKKRRVELKTKKSAAAADVKQQSKSTAKSDKGKGKSKSKSSRNDDSESDDEASGKVPHFEGSESTELIKIRFDPLQKEAWGTTTNQKKLWEKVAQSLYDKGQELHKRYVCCFLFESRDVPQLGAALVE
jgi:hypothetical protein